MNRRGFLGTAIAAAIAGPKAIETVLHRAEIERQMRHQAMVCMANDPMNGIMNRAYRRIQQELLKGLPLTTEEYDWFPEET